MRTVRKLCGELCTTLRRSPRFRYGSRFSANLKLRPLGTSKSNYGRYTMQTSSSNAIINVTCSSPQLIASDCQMRGGFACIGPRLRPSRMRAVWRRRHNRGAVWHSDFANCIEPRPCGRRCHRERPPRTKIRLGFHLDCTPRRGGTSSQLPLSAKPTSLNLEMKCDEIIIIR